MTNQPSANRLFLLGPPSPPYVKLFSWPSLGEMGSKSTEKHEITEMRFFFSSSYFSLPALHLQITFVPLTLYIYALDVSPPPLRLTIRGSFSIPPPPRSLCPSKFPGDFISPISNRIGTQFAMPHVTLPENSTLDIDTS